jgi:hypothetical protein
LAKRIVQGRVIDASGAIIDEGRMGPEAALAFAGRQMAASPSGRSGRQDDQALRGMADLHHGL